MIEDIVTTKLVAEKKIHFNDSPFSRSSRIYFSAEITVLHDSKQINCILIGIGRRFAIISRDTKTLLYEPFHTNDLNAFIISAEMHQFAAFNFAELSKVGRSHIVVQV